MDMNNYWETKEINIGQVRSNTMQFIYFKATAFAPEIETVVPGCGCNKAEWNKETRTLKVTYKAGQVPNHIVDLQTINHRIDVRYKNGQTDQLIFTGVKIR